jgi:regulator of replication initiation timing
MAIEKYLSEKDQLNQLMERNKDLIEALKNLRRKLGGEVVEESEDEIPGSDDESSASTESSGESV